MRHDRPDLPIIGRKEFVDFPRWGLFRVRAKVDTGAWSSSFDVSSWEIRGDEARLRLAPGRRSSPARYPVRGGEDRLTEVVAPIRGWVKVRSSSGCVQDRPLIEVDVRIGPVVRAIRLTLNDRARLRSRMLLGRQALAGAFLVDVSRKYTLTPARPTRTDER